MATRLALDWSLCLGQPLARWFLLNVEDPTNERLKAGRKVLYPLQRILYELQKWNKPTEEKLPVEVDVVDLLRILGKMGYASTMDAMLGNWVLIAYYYLLQVGEYHLYHRKRR